MSSGSLTPGGTETTVVETAVTGDALLELVVDLANMTGGDTVRFRIYRRVNGSDERLEDETIRSDAQAFPVFNLGRVWCNEAMRVRVTIQQTAGTARSFFYRSRVML